MEQEHQDDINDSATISQLVVLGLAYQASAAAMRELAALRDRLTAMLLAQGSLATASRPTIVNLVESINAVVAAGYTQSIEAMDLQSIVDSVAKMTIDDLASSTGKEIATPGAIATSSAIQNTLILGAGLYAWWNHQAVDTAFRVTSAIRAGIVARSEIAEITKSIRTEIETSSARSLDTLAKTAVLSVANEVRQAVFLANQGVVIGKMQISILDSATTLTCRTYANAKWDLAGNPIGFKKLAFGSGTPRHWRCRSFIVPLLFADAKGMSTSDLGRAIESMGSDKARSLFGAGRVAKWKSGEITTQELLNSVR